MKVAFVVSECVPFAKTGGLADVAGALPAKIAELGHEVIVIMPYYHKVKESAENIASIGKRVTAPISVKMVDAELYQARKNGVGFYFIKKDDYYDREQLYGTSEGDYLDNAERFMFFCKAALETLKALDFKPDIIHCHDWQSGLVPALVNEYRPRNGFFHNARCVFTIHNLAYQGSFWHLDMPMTGLPWSYFTPDGFEYYGKINLIKSGIVYSDVINTVSEKYSKEIQTEEYGCGLEGVLKARSERLFGILNGVDYDQWSPEKDEYIAANYSIDNLGGKLECKKDLLQEFNLSYDPKRPLIGVISRLADQKGFDLIADDIDKIMKLNIGFILLGTGEQKYHELFTKIGKRFHRRAGIRIDFDNALAHKIEAGCDMFLMPSRYEPCGLNQIYSLKYGTVPIVRATGGLDDTITDYDPKTGDGNGFKFTQYTPEALIETIKRAVRLFADKKQWAKLVRNGMSCDFSWNKSADKYVRLYETAKTMQCTCEPAAGQRSI